jgi:hypothetical protein
MSGGIAHGHKGLKPGPLTSRTLLLHGHDLHNLILKLILEEVIDDLGLLDRNGEEENLLDGSNLALLDETSELGDGDPDVFVASSLATATTAASSATASFAATAPSSETSAFF